MRNVIEHFDERLDEFLAAFPTGTIYPKYVGSRAKVSDPSIKFFRAYFVDEEIFQILDTCVQVPPIIAEAVRIQEKLRVYFGSGSRFPNDQL
jgi:hypothetical protein